MVILENACILTNYANELDTAGRVIEALSIYRRVMLLNDHFSIARGNYGRALQFLANMVNDSGHYKELHCYAYQAVKVISCLICAASCPGY